MIEAIKKKKKYPQLSKQTGRAGKNQRTAAGRNAGAKCDEFDALAFYSGN